MFDNSSFRLLSTNSSMEATKDAPNVTDPDCPSTNSIAEVTVKALAYLFILLVSFSGNIFLAAVIYKNKQLRKSINFFVFNMAMSDLLTPLTIMPIQIVAIISGSYSWRVDSPWILGDILCKFSYFLPDVSFLVSIESLLLITLDRFIAVVFPLKAKLISSRVHLTSILCTWIIAIAVHAHYFYTFKLMPYGNESYCILYWGPAFDHVETHKRYVTVIFITFILVPICLLAIAYGSIVWTLKAKFKKREQLSCHQRHRDHQLRNIVRLSVAIMMAFVFCMIPQLVFLFTRVFVWDWKVPPICVFRTVIPFIATFMLHSWSAINPCICFAFNKNYRNSLKHMLSFANDRFSREKSDSEDNHLKLTKMTYIRSSQRLPHATMVY
ncbi:neuropeptide FF receptor 2-like [Oculina patagonica]